MKYIIKDTTKLLTSIKWNVHAQNTNKIDKILIKMSDAMKEMSQLFKESDLLKMQIKTVMDVKVISNTKLTNEQMEQYKNCWIDIKNIKKDVDEKMITLSNSNGMKFAQNEIILEDMNTKYIYAILKKAYTLQADIILSLNKIVDIEKNTMQTLQMPTIFDLLSKSENSYELA